MSIIVTIAAAGQLFAGFESERMLRENRRKVRDYSDCIVRKRPADAASAVLSMKDNSELVKTYPKILDEYCFTGFTNSMAFAADLLRFGLADALVRRELADAPALSPSSIAPLIYRDPTPPPSLLIPQDKATATKTISRDHYAFAVAVAYSQVSRLGECVIRANPVGAYRLLKADPTSEAEASEMRAIIPALSGCLNKGNKLNLTKEVLRGTIALNYYRLSKAPRVAPGTVQ